MVNHDRRPNRVYKYRPFNNLTVDQLISDHLFFAAPSTFNDPLDSRPKLRTDIGSAELEPLLHALVRERVAKQMSAAAQTIKYKGPRTQDHIANRSRREADRVVDEVRYQAENPDLQGGDAFQYLLGSEIERELLARYDKGVVSLAERADCPLMWSHYGDQHRGLCVGYSIPDDSVEQLRRVEYGGGRLIAASQVAAMVLDRDAAAARAVDDAVLLRKAREWRYEREWRLIGPRGLRDTPLEFEEVVFGLRCDTAVVYSVVRALSDRHRPVAFFEINERFDSFKLVKSKLDTGEMNVRYPRRSRDIREAFADLDIEALVADGAVLVESQA
ncbi:Protein of unknown function (DUF2971) [Caulobacter sp. AP07]|uniref:DUF2971 domain-containing protein n=1 Tax=Caulobacter sp. AP07 TaxID=1144304 RepID=UPI00027220BC|nr:DUF2971 domain-containing protein [Caulobacter sp. AP07]EJL24716.1 Protein of unknown function (DUF2971) [Caulobacter sp. AP07]